MNLKNYFKIQRNDIKSLYLLIALTALNIRNTDLLSIFLIITLEIAYLVWVFFTLHKANKNPEIRNYGKGYFPTINTLFMSIVFVAMALMGLFFKPLAEKPGMFYYLNLLFLYLILISTTILNYRMIISPDTITYKGVTYNKKEITEIEYNIVYPEINLVCFLYKSNRIIIDLNKFSSEESHEIFNYFIKLREEIETKNNKSLKPISVQRNLWV